MRHASNRFTCVAKQFSVIISCRDLPLHRPDGMLRPERCPAAVWPATRGRRIATTARRLRSATSTQMRTAQLYWT
jgi:hypothetical protein